MMAMRADCLEGATDDGLIHVSEAPARCQITVKGDLDALRDPLSALGFAVPAPLTLTQNDDRMAVWMAPDELLLMAADGAGADILSGFDGAGVRHLAVDVSDARVVVALSGPRVAEVLAKGVPLDLTEPAFATGTARRTHLGPLGVLVLRTGEADWEVLGFRSAAGYLMEWFRTAAAPGSEVFPDG